MNDIIKTIRSLEDSGVLTDGVTETVKHEIKNKKADFLELRTFSPFISTTSNIFISKRHKWERS